MDKQKTVNPVMDKWLPRFLVGYHVIDGFGTIKNTGSIIIRTKAQREPAPILLQEVMDATGYSKDPDFTNPQKARLIITSLSPVEIDLVINTADERYQAFIAAQPVK